MRQDDLKFIYSTWLRSFRESPYAGVVPNHLYRAVYEACISDLLLRGARLDVLCSASDPDYIVGYACWEHHQDKFHGRPVLHYVFVREKFRRLGFARKLTDEVRSLAGPILYTFRIPGDLDRKLHQAGFKHAPYIARIKYRESDEQS